MSTTIDATMKRRGCQACGSRWGWHPDGCPDGKLRRVWAVLVGLSGRGRDA
jgi:hypothetical protein